MKEGPAEGLFYKDPDPPPPANHNSAAPPSNPVDPIEADIFNASNQVEDIAIFRNQGLEVDDVMEPSPKNVPLVETTSAERLFEG